jgi:uncharacterized membrane protein
MKRIKQAILTAAMVLGVGFALVPVSASAIDVFKPCTTGAASDSAVCASSGDKAQDFIKTVVNTLLYILGAIAVIVIIIGGVLFATSSGDASNVKRAKDMITYAVVGLIVAMCAFAIVNFVVGRLS